MEQNDGCAGRKCPCGMWVNCIGYKDESTHNWKVSHGDSFLDEIHEWYENMFRKSESMPEIIPTG